MSKLTVHLGDGFTCVDPVIPEQLKKALTYWSRELALVKNRRVVKGAYKELFELQTKLNSQGQPIDRLYTMPGFTSRCTNTLTQAGYEVQYADHRTPMPPFNMDKAMEGLRDYQYEAVWTALNAGGGILSCPTGFGKTHLIKAILAAYNHSDLIYRNTPLSVVATADMEICRKNYNDLCQMFGKEREIGLVMTGHKKHSDDIQVITFDSLHKIDLSSVGIFIADECHTSATETRTENIMRANKALKWGVSATPMGRFDGGDLVTEGLFGPKVYESSYEEGVNCGALVPLTVCWIDAPPPPIGLDKYLKYKSRRNKYVRGIYLNTDLSRLIVEIIHAIPDEMQTLCIMQFLQQMNEICKHDNTLKIVHGEVSADKIAENQFHDICAVSKKERQDTYDAMYTGEIKKLLSTYIYKQGVNFPSLSVVICPAGGGSELVAGQIPGRASRAGVEGKDSAYIIDFMHPWDLNPDTRAPGPLLRDDKSRARTYKKLKFNQVQINNISEVPFLKNEPIL